MIMSRIVKRTLVLMTLVAFGSLGASSLFAAVPDLTAGEAPPNGKVWFNLGPTGVQAWVYRGPEGKGKRYDPTVETSESRQILVQTIAAGSPADGVLKVGDVILGANGTGAEPVAFTSDARLAFGQAIGDAEARNPGLLKMSVWRAGKTMVLAMTLRTMGAYSATAPYNCPKSAKILEEGLDYIMANEDAGYAGLSTLALLAGNDPKNPKNAARQKKAQDYAYAQCLAQNLIDYIKLGNVETPVKIAWDRGLRLIVLSEYYLKTKDPKVLPSIEAVALSIAHGQGSNGAVGHRFEISIREGVYNDPFTIGYTMNASTLPTALGLVLARKCGINLPELDPAIERVVTTLSATAGLGTFHYYVEGLPLANVNEDNGKSGLGALCFAMQDDRTQETRFFSKLSTGATIDRGRGHIICYPGLIWTPLGANVGGEHAAASFFSGIKAEMDLCRHWNGGFEYERHNAEGEAPSMACSYMWMSTAALLTYAAPLRQIEITGRTFSKRPELILNNDEVAEAVLSDRYDAKTRTRAELLRDLVSEMPRLSSKAAIELAARPEEAQALALPLIKYLEKAKPSQIMGICRALGEFKTAEAIPALIELLSHKDKSIRFLAAEALAKVPSGSLRERLPVLLKKVAANERPIYPMDRNDPQQIANLMLCQAMIGTWGMSGAISNNIVGIDRGLLYPALRAWSTHPQAEVRTRVCRLYKLLTPEDLIALSGTLIDSASEMSLTGAAAMPGDEIISLFHRTGMAEGVPLAKTHILNLRFKNIGGALNLLEKYGAAATAVKPDPQIADFLQSMLVGENNSQIDAKYKNQIARMRDLLLAADNPPPLKSFKQLVSVEASAPVLKLPLNQTRLIATVTDLAGGETIYNWCKVHGPGKVAFSENGTHGSASTTVTLEGVPGRYLFEVTAGDSRQLTAVTGTVAVELRNTKGVLPSNEPPVANGQSVEASQAIPMTVSLTAKDPEGYALVYEIVSPPAHGAISGSAPNLTYLSGFQFTGPDRFAFRVMDSDGQWSAPASVNIMVKTRAAPVGLAVYEPMDYKVGKMKGASGSSEIGFAGPWDINHRTEVVADNLSYGGVPSKGGATSPGWGGARPLAPSALAENGLLDDGAELWLSFQVYYPKTGGGRMALDVGLANNGFDPETKLVMNDGDQLGQGVGVNIGLGTKAVVYESVPSASDEWGNGNGLKEGEGGILVAKMKWGKDQDIVDVYVLRADMTLPKPISILRTKVDQSSFDTIMIRGSVMLDEIRMGPTLESVLLGTVPMSKE